MDQGRLPLRVRVIVISTQVAARNLERQGLDPHPAVRRGLALLETLQRELERDASPTTRRLAGEAREQLVRMLGPADADGSPRRGTGRLDPGAR